MKKANFILLCFCVLLFSGCMKNDLTYEGSNEETLDLTKMSTKGINDQQPADQAKYFLSQFEEVQSVRAVNHEDELLIAVELKQHDRFFLDDLERDLKKEVKKQYRDMQITLSTDKKILLELTELEEAVTNQDISKDDIGKELKRIKKLSKEQT